MHPLHEDFSRAPSRTNGCACMRTSTASVDAFMSRRQHQVLKTAIRLDDQLLREAKTRAARAGNLLNEFIENAFRAALLELMDDDRL